MHLNILEQTVDLVGQAFTAVEIDVGATVAATTSWQSIAITKDGGTLTFYRDRMRHRHQDRRQGHPCDHGQWAIGNWNHASTATGRADRLPVRIRSRAGRSRAARCRRRPIRSWRRFASARSFSRACQTSPGLSPAARNPGIIVLHFTPTSSS